jgi:hypothetical protein
MAAAAIMLEVLDLTSVLRIRVIFIRIRILHISQLLTRQIFLNITLVFLKNLIKAINVTGDQSEEVQYRYVRKTLFSWII